MLNTTAQSNLHTVNLGSDPDTAQAILEHCEAEGITPAEMKLRMMNDGFTGLSEQASRGWDLAWKALQELLKIAGKEDTKCKEPQ